MDTEHWIAGRLRVGLDAIILIAAGLFMRWATEGQSDWPALLARYAANIAIAFGCASLVAWLLIQTWKALRKEKP